jgi:hypothetical protein
LATDLHIYRTFTQAYFSESARIGNYVNKRFVGTRNVGRMRICQGAIAMNRTSNPVSEKKPHLLSGEVLSIPQRACRVNRYTLSKQIAAIRLTRSNDCGGQLGDFCQLKPGVQLDLCGGGYDERTAKVLCSGEFYCVFLQDLYDAVQNRS